MALISKSIRSECEAPVPPASPARELEGRRRRLMVNPSEVLPHRKLSSGIVYEPIHLDRQRVGWVKRGAQPIIFGL